MREDVSIFLKKLVNKTKQTKISQTRPQQKLTVILCLSKVSVFPDEQDRLFDTGSPPRDYITFGVMLLTFLTEKIPILLSLLGLD